MVVGAWPDCIKVLPRSARTSTNRCRTSSGPRNRIVMELATTQQFLDWAAQRHVVPNDPEVSIAERNYFFLGCAPNTESDAQSRYWVIPYETDEHQQDEVNLYY